MTNENDKNRQTGGAPSAQQGGANQPGQQQQGNPSQRPGQDQQGGNPNPGQQQQQDPKTAKEQPERPPGRDAE
jgi:hypothetical protein